MKQYSVAKIIKRFEKPYLQSRFFCKKMIKDYLKEQILSNFGHSPTQDQAKVLDSLAEFIFSPNAREVFLLRGYAGTGKTSLVGALVHTLEQLKRPCVLMAPTGRAAKVFSLYANHPAFTIHKRIYRQKSIDQDSIFSLNFNMLRDVLFIVDEASMISDTADSAFLRSSLLDDLIQFVYAGDQGCQLLLVGDTAQLPPVGDGESPALQPSVLRGYGMTTRCETLTQVVRQKDASGILWNATRLREMIDTENVFVLPKIRFKGFADVKNIPGDELIDTISTCYARFGLDDTMVVTRSNKRAIVYNNGIRNQILGREEEISSGDLLMVAKNNYHWLDSKDGNFIANGDVAVVKRVRNFREMYGFHFADCELAFPDYDDLLVDATVLLDTLHSEAPALTREQQDSLFTRVLEDYADVSTKSERMKKMKEDPYFNALQVKYAYAVTCHKAQGGQWSQIFIDQGYMTEEMLGPDYFRWLYTAITRATHTVHFVNWRTNQTLDAEEDE